MRIAQGLSISRARKAGKGLTVRRAARFTRVDLAGHGSGPTVVTRAKVALSFLGCRIAAGSCCSQSRLDGKIGSKMAQKGGKMATFAGTCHVAIYDATHLLPNCCVNCRRKEHPRAGSRFPGTFAGAALCARAFSAVPGRPVPVGCGPFWGLALAAVRGRVVCVCRCAACSRWPFSSVVAWGLVFRFHPAVAPSFSLARIGVASVGLRFSSISSVLSVALVGSLRGRRSSRRWSSLCSRCFGLPVGFSRPSLPRLRFWVALFGAGLCRVGAGGSISVCCSCPSCFFSGFLGGRSSPSGLVRAGRLVRFRLCSSFLVWVARRVAFFVVRLLVSSALGFSGCAGLWAVFFGWFLARAAVSRPVVSLARRSRWLSSSSLASASSFRFLSYLPFGGLGVVGRCFVSLALFLGPRAVVLGGHLAGLPLGALFAFCVALVSFFLLCVFLVFCPRGAQPSGGVGVYLASGFVVSRGLLFAFPGSFGRVPFCLRLVAGVLFSSLRAFGFVPCCLVALRPPGGGGGDLRVVIACVVSRLCALFVSFLGWVVCSLFCCVSLLSSCAVLFSWLLALCFSLGVWSLSLVLRFFFFGGSVGAGGGLAFGGRGLGGVSGGLVLSFFCGGSLLAPLGGARVRWRWTLCCI